MSISLIANSGIQIHKFRLSFSPQDDIMRSLGFYEYLNSMKGEISLQYAYYLPSDDIWVPKEMLKSEGYLDDEDRPLLDQINTNTLIALEEDKEYFTISDIQDSIELYKDIWLPVPYFKKNRNGKSIFGPTVWARMMFKDLTDYSKKGRHRMTELEVILAFDTKIIADNGQFLTPRYEDTSEDDNLFGLSNNEDLNLKFCNQEYYCGWVDDYLKNHVHNGKLPVDFPSLKYLGYYLYLIKFFDKLEIFPNVSLFSDKQEFIDVDLVLDIGNSRTCGILFESPGVNQPFEFTAVEKLQINDLADPGNTYKDPFSMRLAFAKAQFGEIFIPHYQESFQWPSMVRIGPEAGKLIAGRKIDNLKSSEPYTNHSSPKRYLWDEDPMENPWEFVNMPNEIVYVEGISEQFRSDGEYTEGEDHGVLPFYSRKSLMTLVYLEIFIHAIAQINYHDFREKHGALARPRKLKRITITCPTSIVQKEQIVLRQAAYEALKILEKFGSDPFSPPFTLNPEPDIEIIPSVKDLSKKLDSIDTRKDWIYDEATCCQLVFLYGEISQRYLNDTDTFFKLHGKKRIDLPDPDTNSLTIGTIDIGGGTTDLMICSYQYEPNQSNSLLKPIPLFWESFNFAGDDLLKEIVQQIVIEGEAQSEAERGYKGVIENEARRRNAPDVAKKMLNFFGSDSNKQGAVQRVYRKNFIIQVAVPIALRYLEHVSSGAADRVIGYEEMFPDTKPNADLIQAFNDHFGSGFKFEDIKWTLSKNRVFEIIENTFDPLIKQLSIITSAFGCDFLLLAGRVTNISKLRDLFVKYYPVSPDRIITLNEYRVGRWYPFADDIGYFEDTKTIVSVGALIALMGGKLDKLNNFRIDTRHLRKDLISTAKYIGPLKKETSNVDHIYLSPDENRSEVIISGLPVTVGYKQLPNPNYKGRPIYMLEFNEKQIRKKVLDKNPVLDNENEIRREIEKFKENLKSRMPFKILLKRQMSESYEDVKIDRITDSGRYEVSKNFLSLSLMTLPDRTGYWLDTGEFVLNIR